MEFLTTLLHILPPVLGTATASVKIGLLVTEKIRYMMREARDKKVVTYLHELGCMNEADVRRLVEGWATPAKCTTAQREELITLLTNLVRGARFHTTCGTPVSGFLRCERLIEQLLANIQPVRHKGEPVGPGREEWILDSFLGMGAFGEVWLGRSKLHPDGRAFKFFTREGAADWLSKEQKTLFEVKKQLHKCPNIIEFEDVVIGGQKWPFLVLEYVAGGSLEDWITAHPEDRKRLDISEVVAGIARGLDRAHREKIYHRDLKPANILLTEGPDVLAKIADFGLGTVERDLGTPTASAQVSQAVVVGTQMYLPPEANDPYEPRSPAQDDVFAFGVIWYQLLVGRLERPPYDFAAQLRQLSVPSATIDLIARCLAHPSRRFGDATDLLETLENRLPETWQVPKGCFDVGPLANEYLYSQSR